MEVNETAGAKTTRDRTWFPNSARQHAECASPLSCARHKASDDATLHHRGIPQVNSRRVEPCAHRAAAPYARHAVASACRGQDAPALDGVVEAVGDFAEDGVAAAGGRRSWGRASLARQNGEAGGSLEKGRVVARREGDVSVGAWGHVAAAGLAMTGWERYPQCHGPFPCRYG